MGPPTVLSSNRIIMKKNIAIKQKLYSTVMALSESLEK